VRRRTLTSYWSRAVSALLCCALLTGSASAAPSGKTSTTEIGAGGTILFFLVESIIVNHKAQGSKSQADAIYKDDLSGMAWATPPPSAAPHTLAELYSDVIKSVSSETLLVKQRNEFEDFRGCYNGVLIGATPTPAPASTTAAGPPSTNNQTSTDTSQSDVTGQGDDQMQADPKPSPAGGSGSKKKTKKPSTTKKPKSPTPTAATVPTPAPSKPPTITHSCDDLLRDVTATPAPGHSLDYSASVAPLDYIDLSNALTTAPSLMQQVEDQDVGSHGADDVIRGAFLLQSGWSFIQSIENVGGAPQSAMGVSYSALSDAYKNCTSASSIFDCVSSLGSIENSLAQARNQRVACDWATGVWLPTYSEIRKRLISGLPPSRPPGC
jgi:hypothetical protein